MAALLPSSSLRLSPKLPTGTVTLIPKSRFSSFPSSARPGPSPITITRLPRSNVSPQTPSQTLDSDPRPLLPPPLRDIVALFQSVEDPKAKYHQLLHYASQLPPLPDRFRTDANRVRGCVSQVWVRAYPDPEDPSLVLFQADSDSVLTKGLAALLVRGLSGSPAEAVANVPPEFVQLLGLKQSLTPSRNNGFLNMLRLMQAKAAEISGSAGDGVAGEKDRILDGKVVNSEERMLSGVNGISSMSKEEVFDGKSVDLEDYEEQPDEYGQEGGGMSSGGRAERIRRRLEKELCPVELEVEDISYQHAGHAGAKGLSGGETHFNLKVVSREFEGKSLVKRHRMVYDLLREELETGLHALSIVAKTPSEI